MHRPRPLRVYLRDVVGATGHGLVASLALPDADGLALDGVLAAECADVAGVLRDFHVLHLLTQRGTVPVQVRVIRSFFFFWIRFKAFSREDRDDSPIGGRQRIPGTIFASDSDL